MLRESLKIREGNLATEHHRSEDPALGSRPPQNVDDYRTTTDRRHGPRHVKSGAKIWLRCREPRTRCPK